MIAGPGALSALAALTVALALQFSNGAYDSAALGLMILATLLALSAALWLRFSPPREDPLVARSILGLGCAAGLACNFFFNPTAYGDPRAFQGGFQWFTALALVVLSAYLCIHLRASLIKARFLILLACFLVLGLVVLRASPRPWIDVWTTQTGAADALRDGHNPYSVMFPNPYPEGAFYPPEMVDRGQILAFGYPPLTVLLDLPARVLFGDVRFASLLALLGAAFALSRALPGPSGELAALFVLFQPRTLFVLEQAWTDTVVLLCAALLLWFALRRQSAVAMGVALGLLAASKQYAALIALPLAALIPPQRRARAIFTAALSAAATILPFALWDPRGLFRGVVRLHLLQPIRTDSLSLLAWWSRGQALPAWAPASSFVAAALVLAVTLRKRLNAAQALSSSAAAWLLFVLLNKQAFCNYDWLGAALLCGSAAASVETA